MPIPTPRQAAEELARRSLSDFARTMIPALDLTPFHRSYYDTLDRFARGEIRRLIVSIPPQHGKSLGSSVLLPAYLLGRQPDRRIALASYNLRLASRFNRQIQRLMDASAYRSIFPRTRLKRSSAKDRGTLRTAEEFELVGSRGGLLSVGRDGALTGRPAYSSWTTCTKMRRRPTRRSSATTRGTGTTPSSKPGCTTTRRNCSSSHAGTRTT